jgi:hypothetical protein
MTGLKKEQQPPTENMLDFSYELLDRRRNQAFFLSFVRN